MPSFLKIIMVVLGIAPLLKLLLSMVLLIGFTTVALYITTAYGFIKATSAALVVMYFSGSLVWFVFMRTLTAGRKGKILEWKLMKYSTVRLVSSFL